MAADLKAILKNFKLCVESAQNGSEYFNISCLKHFTAFDSSHIREIIDIFKILLGKNKTFIYCQWIQDDIDFLISKINYLIQSKTIESMEVDILDDLLFLLSAFINRLNVLPNGQDVIIELVLLIFGKNFKALRIIKRTIEMFLFVLKFKEINITNTDDFIKCTEICLTFNFKEDLTFQMFICEEIMGHVLSNCVPEVNKVYEVILCTIEKFSELKNIIPCIKSIRKIYELCTKRYEIMKLTVLIADHIPLYYPLLRSENEKSDIAFILMNVTNNFFKTTPWPGNLQEELCNCPIETSEFRFVIYYIEFLFSKSVHDKNLIKEEVLTLCSNDVLPKNLMVQKCVFLLYSTYLEKDPNSETEKLSSLLVKSLQTKKDLHNYVTYHVSQLIWILCKGTVYLKSQILKLWIKNVPNKVQIAQCVTRVGVEREFINLMLRSTMMCNKKILAEIFAIISKDSPRFPNIVRDAMILFADTETVEFLLGVNPALPKTEREAIFLCGKLCKIVAKNRCKENSHSLVFSYCDYTLVKFGKCKHVVETLLDVDFLSRVVKSSENHKTAHDSIEFLIHIVAGQRLHSVKVGKRLTLNTSFMGLDLQSIPSICQFIAEIITNPNCVLKFPDVPVILYGDLLNLLNVHKFGEEALVAVRYLMTNVPRLLQSSLNASIIITQCNKKSFTPFFLSYLHDWEEKDSQVPIE